MRSLKYTAAAVLFAGTAATTVVLAGGGDGGQSRPALTATSADDRALDDERKAQSPVEEPGVGADAPGHQTFTLGDVSHDNGSALHTGGDVEGAPSSGSPIDRAGDRAPGQDAAAHGDTSDDPPVDPQEATSVPFARGRGGSGHQPALNPEVDVVGSGGGVPLATLDLDSAPPTGFRIPPPTQQHQVGGHGGPDSFAASDGCRSQCITRGTAHARGFGALLVLESHTQAQWFISVMGPDGYQEWWSEPEMRTSLQWGIDHLDPATTYDVMATATDAFGNTSYAWGSFTTLSQRDITYSFGLVDVSGGPSNIDSTSLHFSYDGGPLTNVTPGQGPIMILKDVDRYADLEYWVLRRWNDDLCGAWAIDETTPSYGYSDDHCLVWNSTTVDALDLDQRPGGSSYWTSTEVSVSLQPSQDSGDLPPGYGLPYFDFSVPLTISVTYS